MPDFLERNFCGFQELTTSSLIVFKVLNQHTNQNIGSKSSNMIFMQLDFLEAYILKLPMYIILISLHNPIWITIRIIISNSHCTYFTIAWWVAIWGYFILMFCDFLLLLSQHKKRIIHHKRRWIMQRKNHFQKRKLMNKEWACKNEDFSSQLILQL